MLICLGMDLLRTQAEYMSLKSGGDLSRHLLSVFAQPQAVHPRLISSTVAGLKSRELKYMSLGKLRLLKDVSLVEVQTRSHLGFAFDLSFW